MRPRHVALVIITVAAFGGVWTAYDDGFGRPPKIAHQEEDFRTVPIIPPSPDLYSATFSICTGLVRVNCVVDGDTFWFKGDKYHIADIDAPEISEPRCLKEKQAGGTVRDRLVTLLNAEPFSMTSGWRDRDHHGRKLRNVVRAGTSRRGTLVEEGLSRRWDGPSVDWCGDDEA